jgi:hypothetical protein
VLLQSAVAGDARTTFKPAITDAMAIEELTTRFVSRTVIPSHILERSVATYSSGHV